MASLASIGLLSAFAPLHAKFGERLSLRRDGNVVQWSLEGRLAIVELRSESVVHATFVERPALDSVSASPAAAVYRSSPTGYRLAADGCARMVEDMCAFFSGAREPRFAFVGIHGGPPALS